MNAGCCTKREIRDEGLGIGEQDEKQEKKRFEVDTGSMVLQYFCNGGCPSDRELESYLNGKHPMCTDTGNDHCKF